jgi:hypothetical protein
VPLLLFSFLLRFPDLFVFCCCFAYFFCRSVNDTEIRLADGASYSSLTFTHRQVFLDQRTVRSFVIEKIPQGRLVTMYLDEEYLTSQIASGVTGNLYDGTSGFIVGAAGYVVFFVVQM